MRQTTSALRLRVATIDDLALLRHWDEQPHVIASDPYTEWNWETELLRDPPWREQLIAEVDGRSIGFLRIIDPALEELEDSRRLWPHVWRSVPDSLRAIDIWIGEADSLGKGCGSTMMRLAIERCFGLPQVQAVLVATLVTNAASRRFYERLGFRHVEDWWCGRNHCAVYELSRVAPTEQLALPAVGPSGEAHGEVIIYSGHYRR